MPRFSYKSYTPSGVLTEGSLLSESREAAIEALRQRGEFPLEIVSGGTQPVERWWQREVFGGRGLSHKDLALLTRELATLVKAELPLDEALRIVSLQPAISARTRQAARSVLSRLVDGASLSEALAQEGRTFPALYARTIAAGEAGGTLAPVLDDLATYLERSGEARARLNAALLYPLILLVAAAGALILIMAVLLPAIAPLFKDAGATPPLLVRLLLQIQSSLAGNAAGWALVLVGAVLGVALLSRQEGLAASRDRLLLGLPLAGTFIERRETARFSRTLAMLIRSGVPVLDALHVTREVAASRAYAAALATVADEVKEGGTLTAPLAASELFPELAVRLIGVGERSGQLEEMLTRVADIHEEALQRQVLRMTSLLSPVLTIVIGLVVGGLILSVMSAIVSVNELAIK